MRIPKGGVLVTNPNAQYLDMLAQVAEKQGVTVVDYTQYAQHNWDLNVPGQYNVNNAAAALTACIQLGLETSVVQKAIETKFETADRRFQLLGMTTDGAPVYDDYAHNVEALDLLIEGVQKKYSDKKMILVYQLHEYSRTENFLEGWVNALGKVDTVYLMPIYGAREKAEDFTIRSEDVARLVMEKNPQCTVIATENIEHTVAEIESANYNQDNIVVCAGAGQADQVGKKLVS